MSAPAVPNAAAIAAIAGIAALGIGAAIAAQNSRRFDRGYVEPGYGRGRANRCWVGRWCKHCHLQWFDAAVFEDGDPVDMVGCCCSRLHPSQLGGNRRIAWRLQPPTVCEQCRLTQRRADGRQEEKMAGCEGFASSVMHDANRTPSSVEWSGARLSVDQDMVAEIEFSQIVSGQVKSSQLKSTQVKFSTVEKRPTRYAP
jgi:hypothetical protein